MKTSIFLICFLLQQGVIFSQNQTQVIQDVFDKYKSAILTGRETDAISYMDARTLDYFKKILNLVITADSLTLEAQPLMDKFTVLNIRHLATKKQILAFDEKSIIVFVIKNNMMGKNTLEGFTLGKITVKDLTAKALIVEDGKKSNKFFNFYSDGKEWKIDYTSVFPAEEKETDDLIRKTGKSDNEFILGMIELMSDRKPSPNIWKKIK